MVQGMAIALSVKFLIIIELQKIQENVTDNILVLGCSVPKRQLSILQFISGFL